MGEDLGCSNEGEDCLQREREKACGSFRDSGRRLERERESIWESGKVAAKTLSGINVLAAHALGSV